MSRSTVSGHGPMGRPRQSPSLPPPSWPRMPAPPSRWRRTAVAITMTLTTTRWIAYVLLVTSCLLSLDDLTSMEVVAGATAASASDVNDTYNVNGESTTTAAAYNDTKGETL